MEKRVLEQKQAALQPEAAKGGASGAPPQPDHLQSAELDSGALFMQRLHATAGNCDAGRWFQAKLRVGSPNDAYEQEADRIADQVMRMPDPATVTRATAPEIQRKCAQCEEDEHGTIQRKCAQCALAEKQSKGEDTEHTASATLPRKCAQCEDETLRMKSAEQPFTHEDARETATPDEIHQSGIS